MGMEPFSLHTLTNASILLLKYKIKRCIEEEKNLRICVYLPDLETNNAVVVLSAGFHI